MTAPWRHILVRCGLAGFCGAAYTALALGQGWFTDAPEDLAAHLGRIAGATIMAMVAAAMVYGLEYVLAPDLSSGSFEEADLADAPLLDIDAG